MKNILFLSTLWVLFGCCSIQHVYERTNQMVKGNGAVRIFMDRYGDYYPDTAVNIDSKSFGIKASTTNHKSASLDDYFYGKPERIKALRKFYKIPDGKSDTDSYKMTQDSIIAIYAKSIKEKLKTADKKVVFIIHGFNDAHPEAEYARLRKMIDSSFFNGIAKPVYIEIYWDGLTTARKDSANDLKIANIWQPAIFNSRFVGLSLRKIVNAVEREMPVSLIIVTHSLGAGVATGMLFNNESKFGNNFSFHAGLDELIKIPTTNANVRLGMLAPAIPGILTFKDFNDRVPNGKILPSQNHIDKIVDGYNEKDYATTITVVFNLSLLYGSTTLGCNYMDQIKQHREFELVRDKFKDLGYSTEELAHLWVPQEFQTEPKGKLQQHLMPFYLSASPYIHLFLDDLFKD